MKSALNAEQIRFFVSCQTAQCKKEWARLSEFELSVDLYFYVAQPLHDVEEEEEKEEGKDDEIYCRWTQGQPGRQAGTQRSLDDALLRRRTQGKMSSFLRSVEKLTRLFHRCALPEMYLLYNTLYNWSTAGKKSLLARWR